MHTPQFGLPKPNNWSKSIKKQVAGDTETEKLRLEFRSEFHDYLNNKHLDILTHGNATTDHWCNFRAGITGFHYACVLTIKNWIGVQVYFCSDKPEQNKERYDFVEKTASARLTL